MSEPPLPPAFKPLKAYLQRSEELERGAPSEMTKVVTYYCRQFAMERGLELRSQDTTNQANGYLAYLMGKLEADKKKLTQPHTREMGQEMITQFANDVFDKADSEDRAGFADKNTARGFYAASIFFEILRQFGEYEESIDTKRKYSKWKSAEIVKAIKEGRPIVPGGPDGIMADDMNAAPNAAPTQPAPANPPTSSPQNVPAAPVSPPAVAPTALPGAKAPANVYNPGYTAPIQPPVSQHVHAPSAAAANFVPVSSNYPPGSLQTEDGKIDDAIEFSSYAIRMLEHRDVNGGLQYLEQAIALLKANH